MLQLLRPLRPFRPRALRARIACPRKSSARLLHHSSTSFPVTERCPSPTCACAEMPAFPDGLEINYERKLYGSMPAYAEQVLVCTGQADWTSRIEDERSGDNLANDLKELLIRGEYSDPYNNISVLNSSFPPSISPRKGLENASAYLLPSFLYVPFLPRVSFDHVQALVRGYLQPTKLHPEHDKLSPIHRDRLTQSSLHRGLLDGVQEVQDYLVLICGHGGRDMRCGVLGAVLGKEFERLLPQFGVQVVTGPVTIPDQSTAAELQGASSDAVLSTARIGMISHVGGHVLAGNVIVYIPPKARLSDGSAHPLAGTGIWYGRIEPKHVEGVIKQTIMNGTVIAEHFRGGIRQGGEILRL